ncbi:MAG: SAM-dependent methyltransferase [Parcubacteria group bacterium]|nr:SAM-dependent methyltransferase [Parcubacteria group bacterium]
MHVVTAHPSSFRDPSGFIYTDSQSGALFRQVNKSYQEHYDALMSSGLYRELVASRQLIEHKELPAEESPRHEERYKVIHPRRVPFISYPFEWSFSQLKDAALLTLAIQKKALEHGMVLKDASAYNMQFLDGKPILIDTLSFEKYAAGSPWIAYRQFCQHFLAPLALMAYTDIRLSQWLRIHMDGVPLDLASALLPFRTYFLFGLLSHIHLHAKSQAHFSGKTSTAAQRQMRKTSLLGLLDNLESVVRRLRWRPRGTEWAEYYTFTNYSNESFEHKKKLTAAFLEKSGARSVWDVGANDGTFSRIASTRGIATVSFDYDPASVEKNYLRMRRDNDARLLPLLMDVLNPSPDLGWENKERDSLIMRGPADCTFALALIHHLVISNNVPLTRIASFFSSIARHLIIEFVPKSDSQVQKLLATRRDIFPDYTKESFEREFSAYFSIMERAPIAGSERILYLMKNNHVTRNA